MRLFVYGTLRSDGTRHDFVRPFLMRPPVPAAAAGRVEQLPEGYPVLRVSRQNLLVRGSGNRIADLRRDFPHVRPPVGDDAVVAGEILELPDDAELLERLDDYEDFVPDGPSVYLRIAVPVRANGSGFVPAWCYATLDG